VPEDKDSFLLIIAVIRDQRVLGCVGGGSRASRLPRYSIMPLLKQNIVESAVVSRRRQLHKRDLSACRRGY